MDGIIAEADLVLLLTADAAQAEGFRAIQARMKPGSTLGLSHGFVVGHMKNERAEFRHDIKVSRAAESHHRALAEPDVKLSPHPAPFAQPRPWSRPQWANMRGCL